MRSNLQMGWASTRWAFPPPRQRTDLIEEDLDGEAVLIDPRDGGSHRFNRTALSVWRGCDGSRNNREIAERLVDAYDVSFEDALDHVNQLVVRFSELRLLSAASCA